MEIKRPRLYRAGKPTRFAVGTAAYGARGIVYLSGVTGTDPDTGAIAEGVGEQTRIIMEQIKKSLEEFGTSLENILQLFCYMVGPFPNGIVYDPKYRERNEVLEEFWKKHCPEFCQDKNPPSWHALFGVDCLALPKLLIEMAVVAAIP